MRAAGWQCLSWRTERYVAGGSHDDEPTQLAAHDKPRRRVQAERQRAQQLQQPFDLPDLAKASAGSCCSASQRTCGDATPCREIDRLLDRPQLFCVLLGGVPRNAACCSEAIELLRDDALTLAQAFDETLDAHLLSKGMISMRTPST